MKIKNILALVLALALCLSVAACGGEKKSADKYKVTILDDQGNPMSSGVIVRILQNGQQVAMQVANEQGVVEPDLKKGDYTVELKFTDANAAYYYDSKNLTLTAENKQLTIQLYKMANESATLFAPTLDGEGAEVTAYVLNVGSTYVKPEINVRNYYLFTPLQAGSFRFSLTEGSGKLGYYGAPHFVQSATAVDLAEDGSVTLSVAPGMLGGTFVLGLDAEEDTALLTLERTGDHVRTIEDEPWTEFVTTHTPSKFTFTAAAGKKLTYVDIYEGTAADYNVVLGTDGYYHMGTQDGPVVYLNLGKKAPNVSLYVVVNGDGLGGGSPVREYFYNESGEFVKKEDYTAVLSAYFACMDEDTGLYPLTEDLAYILKTRSGWWTEGDPDYIFEGCNPEIGWLFACCYEQ